MVWPRSLRALRRRRDEPRFARQAARLDELTRRVKAHAARLDRQGDRLDNQSRRIDQVNDRLRSWTPFIANLRVESGAISTQLTALEKRVADLESAPVDPGSEADRAQARSIVELAQAEHARIRARLTLISAYEERLRRLEVAMREVVRVGGIVPEPMPFQLPVEAGSAGEQPDAPPAEQARRLA